MGIVELAVEVIRIGSGRSSSGSESPESLRSEHFMLFQRPTTLALQLMKLMLEAVRTSNPANATIRRIGGRRRVAAPRSCCADLGWPDPR